MILSNIILEIKTDGFQVVSADMFRPLARVFTPALTIWPTSLSFSKAAVTALNNCERILIRINQDAKSILIAPVTEKDKDSIRWIKSVEDPQSKKLDCVPFTSQLYKTWEWDYNNVYRASGKLVSVDKKVMLLFDFTSAETWSLNDKKKDTQNA